MISAQSSSAALRLILPIFFDPSLAERAGGVEFAVGYLVNQGFIWVLVKQLGGPSWWPTIPMVFLTPLLTFTLHRKFVYA